MKYILLVDDDPQLLKALARMLQPYSAEWEVTTAGDGIEALRRVRERDFDLLITDIVMPNQDGLGTIRAVRKARPQTRIIAMTGGGVRVGTDFLPIARALGANVILQKPFSIETLIDAVRSQLSSETPGSPPTHPGLEPDA